MNSASNQIVGNDPKPSFLPLVHNAATQSPLTNHQTPQRGAGGRGEAH